MAITKEQESKVWEYINKFNEQNAPKPGTRSAAPVWYSSGVSLLQD